MLHTNKFGPWSYDHLTDTNKFVPCSYGHLSEKPPLCYAQINSCPGSIVTYQKKIEEYLDPTVLLLKESKKYTLFNISFWNTSKFKNEKQQKSQKTTTNLPEIILYIYFLRYYPTYSGRGVSLHLLHSSESHEVLGKTESYDISFVPIYLSHSIFDVRIPWSCLQVSWSLPSLTENLLPFVSRSPGYSWRKLLLIWSLPVPGSWLYSTILFLSMFTIPSTVPSTVQSWCCCYYYNTCWCCCCCTGPCSTADCLSCCSSCYSCCNHSSHFQSTVVAS